MATEVPEQADNVVIIGAGPAGLTAAYLLAKADKTATVLEADSVVGGISRTAQRDGWRFDIGGHRFFTKVQPVEDFWHEILPDEDFLLRPRMSRIYYEGKFYDYPLKGMNALKNLGFIEAARCVLSYGWARIRPPREQGNLEGWVTARFGSRLYRHFFKTYTEKVWGVPATELQADWAAQRIKNLSLSKAIVNALLPKRNQKDITSLIEEFQYPKYGPGMMWERCREKVEAAGTKVIMETKVTKVRHTGGRAVAVVAESADGTETEYLASAVVSSMPITALVKTMDPQVPPEVAAAADDLHYRDFLTIALIVPEEAGFPDNWIYVHSPEVKVGRIQNFGSWSPYLVKEGRTCLGLEYFVFEGDEHWTMNDDQLVELGKRELAVLGLVDPDQVEAGYVVRMPKAYPYYDADYLTNVETLRRWLEANTHNVYPVGRNGMHKYNNQDHSMYTAMLSVENLLGANHDVWSVNVEDDYHEEKRSANSNGNGTGRDAADSSQADMTTFLPSNNGLHFDNSFPNEPAINVNLGVTTIPVGNAANGLCGGMVFTALDYWTEGTSPPADTTPPASGTPLFGYLVSRLIDSWSLPSGPLTYLALMNPMFPDADQGVGPLTVHGRSWRMVAKEWPAIQATLDRGQPCPLGLVKIRSANPLDLGHNHQVLAYNYALAGTALQLAVYDPNQADRDDVVIALDLADPSKPVSATLGAPGDNQDPILCFFKTDYTAKSPPAG